MVRDLSGESDVHAAAKSGRSATILVLAGAFWPAYRAGGTVQTLKHMTEAIGDEFRFLVVTSNRDLGCKTPLDVETDRFIPVGRAEVCYLSSSKYTPLRILRVLRRLRYDVLYVNSYHSPLFGAWPLMARRLGLLPDLPTVLAPRGELAVGALHSGGTIRRSKKWAYRQLANMLGCYRKLLWHASSKWEAADILRQYPRARVHVAPDLAASGPPRRRCHVKTPGQARFVFVGRIAPVKNLHLALQWIGETHGTVTLDVYGPVDDTAYFERCQSLGANMMGRVQFHGAVSPLAVREALAVADFLLLPSSSENYGHAIVEALGAGVPVVIGDGTQWRGLVEVCAGWDLSLSRPNAFIQTLQTCVDMEAGEYQSWSDGAVRFAGEHVNSEDTLERNRLLFREALSVRA